MNKYLINILTIALSLFLLPVTLLGADTLRVMHYNLLFYDRNTSFCTPQNNNVDQKDENLGKILSYYQPDIFTANEINSSPESVERILTNTLNKDSINIYKRANYTGDYLVNMLYYNSEKLGLKAQSYVNTSPRITDVYTLYVRNEGAARGDTTFIVCIVMHLKAGQGDESARAEAAQQIMDFIAHRSIEENIMLIGDLNVYCSSEDAFQIFTTPNSNGTYFADPVDAIGTWHKNPEFAMYHTQSTRTVGDCFVTGGMDDRFDFILTTPEMLDEGGIEYIEDTYWALGQDGNRLMGSLIEPENTSLPSHIIDALYNTSDHLPVVLKLRISDKTISTNQSTYVHDMKYDIHFRYTSDESIVIWSKSRNTASVYVDIYSTMGTKLHSCRVHLNQTTPSYVNISFLQPGAYVLTIKEGSARQIGGLLVKR